MGVRAAVGAVLLAGLIGLAATAPAEAKKRATLSGVVWSDVDADGRREKGEPRLAGARVRIQRRDGKRFRFHAKRTTDARGRWSVPIRARLTLRVRVTLPAGSAGFSPPDVGAQAADSDVTAKGLATVGGLRPRGRSRRIDAGVVPASPVTPGPPIEPPPDPAPGPTPPPDPTIAPITGMAFSDTNDDGVRQPGEPPAAGVTVELWDAAPATMLTTTTSAADGTWSLALPAAGSYRVRVILPSATIYSPADAGTDDALDSDVAPAGATSGFTAAVPEGTTTVGIGLRSGHPISIGNRVWRDTNNDGLQGPSPPAGSATVELWNDGLTQMLASVSASGGLYSLPAIANGTYRVRAVVSNYVIGKQDQGADDSDDSDVGPYGDPVGVSASLTPAISTVNVDIALAQVINIGNLVWNDLNSDGDQDAGEPGVAGLTVQLWNSAKSKLWDTATTSATGIYSLQAPGADDYRVRFVLNATGQAFTGKNLGGDDQLDSDVNPTGTNTGFTDIYNLADNLISITTIDAGLTT